MDAPGAETTRKTALAFVGCLGWPMAGSSQVCPDSRGRRTLRRLDRSEIPLARLCRCQEVSAVAA